MRYIIIILSCVFITACSNNLSDIADKFDFSKKQQRLPGERESIDLIKEDDITIDMNDQIDLVFPQSRHYDTWTHYGRDSDHDGGHAIISHDLKRIWSKDLSDGDFPLSLQPIIANNILYIFDDEYILYAIRADNGQVIWSYQLPIREDQEDSFGGGLAYAHGKIYATTGYGYIFAINAKNGEVLWQFNVQSPIRSAPTTHNNIVIVVTLDNQAYAFHTDDGAVVWTHRGFKVTTSISGQRMATIKFTEAYIPYSSGELFALRLENGRRLWQDSLSSSQIHDTISSLADIGGYSAISADTIIATSNSNKTIAWNRVDGRRLWSRDFGGAQPPWVIGDYAILLTLKAELLLISLKDGKVVWQQQLQRYINEIKQKNDVSWSAPVVASERIYLTNNLGHIESFDLKTGAAIRQFDLDANSYNMPVIVNNIMYIFTDQGQIQAWQ